MTYGISGGWNCSVCGQWVQSGSVHSCPWPPRSSGTTDATQLAHILMALGRIEQLLLGLKEKKP